MRGHLTLTRLRLRPNGEAPEPRKKKPKAPAKKPPAKRPKAKAKERPKGNANAKETKQPPKSLGAVDSCSDEEGAHKPVLKASARVHPPQLSGKKSKAPVQRVADSTLSGTNEQAAASTAVPKSTIPADDSSEPPDDSSEPSDELLRRLRGRCTREKANIHEGLGRRLTAARLVRRGLA
jgi:hypothetical protein